MEKLDTVIERGSKWTAGVDHWQVEASARQASRCLLTANTGWPVNQDFCPSSSAFTLGSTCCCWGGCSTSYWIANLFLGGLFQWGGQMRVEKAIRHPRGQKMVNLSEATTMQRWSGAEREREKCIFTQREHPPTDFHGITAFIWRPMWLSPSRDHSAPYSDGLGGGAHSAVSCSLNQDDVRPLSADTVMEGSTNDMWVGRGSMLAEGKALTYSDRRGRSN